VRNLPVSITEQQLRDHFRDCGQIENINIVRDKDTLICTGIAYLKFSTIDEMKKAIKTKNKSYLNVTIHIMITTYS
jgi:nucleolar protein 12